MAAERTEVIVLDMEDRPGTLYEALARIAHEGIDLASFSGMQTGAGRGRLYAMPKPGAGAGDFDTVAAVAITGEDHVGSAGQALQPLAEAGVNVEAAGAFVADGRMMLVAVVDDVDKALKALGQA